MARLLYGASPAEYFADASGAPVPGATAQVWTARTGGSQVTDLQDISNAAITTVVADSFGGFRFYGPDGTTGELWVLAPGGTLRYKVEPTNVATTAAAASTAATAAQATATAAQTTADTAQTTATAASTTANTASTAANTAQTTANTAQTTANTAQTTANTAQTSADSANATALLSRNLYQVVGPTSGAVTLDANLGTIIELRLSGNVSSLTINNPPLAGSSITLIVVQDATGGRTVAFPATWFWENDTPVGADTLASRETVFELFYAPSAKVRAQYVGKRYGQSPAAAFKSTLLTMPGLRYAYDFQDAFGSGTTTATDATANARNGTWVGTPTFGAAGLLPSDVADTSVTLSGDDHLTVDHSKVADQNAEFSLVMVCMIPAASAKVVYSENNNADANTNPSFQIQTGNTGAFNQFRVIWRNSAGTVLLDSLAGTPFDNTARLVILTFKAGSLKLYVDGVLVTTWTITVAGTWGALVATWFAQRRLTASSWVSGDVSYVAAGTTELSAAQVATLQAAR